MNTEILNWLGTLWEGNQGGVKRTIGDEPIRVIIYIHMETTQGISLCRCLYLKLAKTPHFCFDLLCVFFYKSREQEGGTGSGMGVFGEGRRGGSGERGRRMNMV
jgi:hypothetical protein